MVLSLELLVNKLSAIGPAVKSVGWMASIGHPYQPNALRR